MNLSHFIEGSASFQIICDVTLLWIMRGTFKTSALWLLRGAV
jgi:hypothetical protein